ncbi:MAG TPA: sugar transferase, partial [Clostridiales bacterium]|nr:sugar transferase [Clostridiales bacterium]
MKATLLLPAGITSEASIRFKEESSALESEEDVDRIYLEEVLPQKMVYNLESIQNFNILKELCTMIKTVLAVLQ